MIQLFFFFYLILTLLCYMCVCFFQETGKTIDNSEVFRAYKFGNEYIPFSSQQLSGIRKLGDPGKYYIYITHKNFFSLLNLTNFFL